MQANRAENRCHSSWTATHVTRRTCACSPDHEESTAVRAALEAQGTRELCPQNRAWGWLSQIRAKCPFGSQNAKLPGLGSQPPLGRFRRLAHPCVAHEPYYVHVPVQMSYDRAARQQSSGFRLNPVEPHMWWSWKTVLQDAVIAPPPARTT